MIKILSSTATKPSTSFTDQQRKKGEDNLQWLIRNLPSEDRSHLVMVGGKSPTDFRLRVAQSHLRHDMAPSHWSHAFLLGKIGKNAASATAHEISLQPQDGFGFPPPTNGVQKGKVGRYANPDEYPNIAVLGVPVAQDEVLKALDR
ncbi:MAG TPA: hypothetical protein VG778_04440, partial [Blastocatellia bacterium]|nr:hypothetical protein [Blastocatellia bacterium]